MSILTHQQEDIVKVKETACLTLYYVVAYSQCQSQDQPVENLSADVV